MPYVDGFVVALNHQSDRYVFTIPLLHQSFSLTIQR